MKEKRFELKEIVKYISNCPLDDNFSVYIIEYNEDREYQIDYLEISAFF